MTSTGLADMAAAELQRRRLRVSYFPDVFFGGEQRGLHMSIEELLELSGGDTMAGNRWLAQLAAANHVSMSESGSADQAAKLMPDASRRLAEWLIASPGWPH